MHVLILNQTFYPDVASTAQLMWDLARHLDQAGHRVTAVTSSYYYGSDQPFATRHEKHGNIEIVRVWQTGFGKKHLLGRLCDFASFYIMAAWELWQQPIPDVILSLTSPPMISSLAMLARQFFRRPDGSPVRFVYHVMDLYPDAAIAPGVIGEDSIPARATGFLTQRTLAVADATIVLGRDMRDRLIARYHARPERLHVVQPWGEGDTLRPIAKSKNPLITELGLADTFNVVYSGNLGIAHDLETLVCAIEKTRDEMGLRWVFIGGGKRFDVLRQQAKAAQWPNVLLLPFQDRENLNLSLNLADVHLVSQLPAFTGVVVPSKLFGIMAVGKPTIMIGPDDAECSLIIRENNLGFVVPNGDSDQLVRRILELRGQSTLGENAGICARKILESQYDRPVACEKIRLILESVVLNKPNFGP